MILPLTSAVGDDTSPRVAVRKVLAMCFPSLCCLLKDSFTANEINAAWLCMPLVRTAKGARGTWAGQQRGGRWRTQEAPG